MSDKPTPKPPAVPKTDIVQAFKKGSPMQQLFGEVFEELGGIDFMTEWAEDNPGEFIRLMVAQMPAPVEASKGGTNNVINIHPGLAPGPLDAKVVSEQ